MCDYGIAPTLVPVAPRHRDPKCAPILSWEELLFEHSLYGQAAANSQLFCPREKINGAYGLAHKRDGYYAQIETFNLYNCELLDMMQSIDMRQTILIYV